MQCSIAYSATSVLPAPVGAETRTSRSARIAAIAARWNAFSVKPRQWTMAPGASSAAGGGRRSKGGKTVRDSLGRGLATEDHEESPPPLPPRARLRSDDGGFVTARH